MCSSDLAEETPCVFTLMLDDSYFLKGDLRSFLHRMRTDDFADSFSLMIVQDISYTSNRISKTCKRLRYKYRIHEILEENVNVQIPKSVAWLRDVRTQEHVNRTTKRKQLDIQLLMEDMKDYPEDPRLIYYLAETYLYLHQYEKAYNYYLRRVQMVGFDEERYDASYKAAVIAELYLLYDWSKCLQLYLQTYEMNPNRVDVLYQLASHYHKEGSHHTALLYAEKALGNDNATTLGIKNDMKRYYLPQLVNTLRKLISSEVK